MGTIKSSEEGFRKTTQNNKFVPNLFPDFRWIASIVTNAQFRLNPKFRMRPSTRDKQSHQDQSYSRRLFPIIFCVTGINFIIIFFYLIIILFILFLFSVNKRTSSINMIPLGLVSTLSWKKASVETLRHYVFFYFDLSSLFCFFFKLKMFFLF